MGNKELPLEVIVFKGKATDILSHQTSNEFDVLKTGSKINAISNSKSPGVI